MKRIWSWHTYKIDPAEQPHIFAMRSVPLNVWIKHPLEGYKSYRRVIQGLSTEIEMKKLTKRYGKK